MNSMTADEARTKFREFGSTLPTVERDLGHTGLDEDASAETVEKCREYFGSLTNYNLKIAAIAWLRPKAYGISNRLSTRQRLELVGPFLEDRSAYIRSAAADAIAANGGGSRYATELIKLLAEPYSNVKLSAMRAMSGKEQFSIQILPYLQDANPTIRVAALRSLGFKPAWETNIAARLEDAHAEVRINAMQVLACDPQRKHLKAIEMMLKDPNSSVRSLAIQELALTSKNKASADYIAALLLDEDGRVRARAAQGLAELQATNYADSVCLLLDDKEVIPRRFAVGSLAACRT